MFRTLIKYPVLLAKDWRDNVGDSWTSADVDSRAAKRERDRAEREQTAVHLPTKVKNSATDRDPQSNNAKRTKEQHLDTPIYLLKQTHKKEKPALPPWKNLS
eukprot:scaffold3971_cov159-Amphora_coffeaeformis.AAC.9